MCRWFDLRLASLLVAALALAACAPAPAAPAVAPVAPAPAAAAAAPAASAPQPPAQEPIVVRFAVVAPGAQTFVPLILKDNGIGRKYGFDVRIVESTNALQPWNTMRAGEADILPGSLFTLLRNRQGGLQATTIRGLWTADSSVVAPTEKPYQTLTDLKGARVGTPNATLDHWIMLRGASLKADGFDVAAETQVSEASPILMNQMLSRDQLDAAFQFNDVIVEPLAEGKIKVITTVPTVMTAAGLDPRANPLAFFLADNWRARNPGAVAPLVAAMDEAVDLMIKDDSVWPALIKPLGMTDPKVVTSFIEMQRARLKAGNESHSRALVEAHQQLLDELVKLVGAEAFGRATRVELSAFDFESADAAKQLRR